MITHTTDQFILDPKSKLLTSSYWVPSQNHWPVHIGSQVKTRQGQSYKFQEFVKTSNLWILKFTEIHSGHDSVHEWILLWVVIKVYGYPVWINGLRETRINTRIRFSHECHSWIWIVNSFWFECHSWIWIVNSFWFDKSMYGTHAFTVCCMTPCRWF